MAPTTYVSSQKFKDLYAWTQELAGTGGPGMRDVFDYPDAEPSELFINPFSCAIDPFMWRELQVCLMHREANV